jgi:hypothetical protein
MLPWCWATWPESLKVIDVPLHKYLKADGERRVRASTADDAQAKRSITLVKVVQRFAGFTLLDVSIKTGRTHQIRVHLAHAGHAIVGDDKYGDFDFNKSLARGTRTAGQRYDGMFLHARRLAFDHPASDERIELARAVARGLLLGAAAGQLERRGLRTLDMKDDPRRFDLIAFDWDGTLFDSTGLIVRCIQAACRDVGMPVPGDVQALT